MNFRRKKYVCAIVALGLLGITQSYAAPGGVVAISGTISTPSSQGISGVTITFSNGGPSVVSGVNGNYTATVASGYNGSATPSLAGYTFSPTSRQYGNIGADVPGADYTGTLTAAPDFTIGVTPPSQAVTAGNSVNYTVTITPTQGFNSSVNLSCTTVPIGVSCSFAPNPATNTTTLTVSTIASASSGGITVTGISGSLTHTGSANLTVNPAPGPIDDPTLLLWFFFA
jgi:hypothetical protein